MDNISRRRFVRMLAGIPLIGIATRSTSVMAERTRLAIVKSRRLKVFCDGSLIAGLSRGELFSWKQERDAKFLSDDSVWKR